jgi:hypothetical protein
MTSCNSCALSGITLGIGDEVCFFFLAQRNSHDGWSSIMRMMVYDKCDFYKPIFFPIVAKYDDYGYLYDVERDINTEAIEKITKKDINECLLSQSGVASVINNRNYSCMYVHKSIYDKVTHELDSVNVPSRDDLCKSFDKVVAYIDKGECKHGDNFHSYFRGFIPYPSSIKNTLYNFNDVYFDYLKDIKDHIVDFCLFDNAMYLLNKVYFPTYAGPHIRNYKAHSVIDKHITDLIKSKIQSMNEIQSMKKKKRRGTSYVR